MGTAYFQAYLRNMQKVWSVGAYRPEDVPEGGPPVIVGPHQTFDEWCKVKAAEKAGSAEALSARGPERRSVARQKAVPAAA